MIVLHICCAVDAAYYIKRMREEFKDEKIIGYFYDPNIHPKEEYDLRLLETKRVCKELNIELIEGPYEVESWMDYVKGYEDEPERQKRCELCFDFRLYKSFEFAKSLNANKVSTALLMSPKKDLNQLKKVGEEIAKKFDMEFIFRDYRKNGGSKELLEFSKALEIYHQDYCGCVYALVKQKMDNAKFDLISYPYRKAGSKLELSFIKQVRELSLDFGLKSSEEMFEFIGYDVFESKLETQDKEFIPHLVVPYSWSLKGVSNASFERSKDNVLFFNRDNIKVFIKESMINEIVPFNTIPFRAFVVHKSFEEKLKNQRVKFSLKSELTLKKSSILTIGSKDAKKSILLPADEIEGKKGIKLEDIKLLLEQNVEDIKTGLLNVRVKGAYYVT